MDSYRGFAKVYDLFMEDVPYKEWSRWIAEMLRAHGIEDGLVLDLACGTGVMTELLAEAGYDMIGIDQSEEMLERALDRKEQSGHDILYLCQDMREFELYGTVRAIVSVCDSMNYVLEEEAFLDILTAAAENYLDYGGLFLFDLNTEYKYRMLLGEQTIAENRGEGSFISENSYDEEEKINEYELTLFIREDSGYYRKYEEVHYQRAYPLDTVKELVARSGLKLLQVCDAYTGEPVREDSERICVVCRRELP